MVTAQVTLQNDKEEFDISNGVTTPSKDDVSQINLLIATASVNHENASRKTKITPRVLKHFPVPIANRCCALLPVETTNLTHEMNRIFGPVLNDRIDSTCGVHVCSPITAGSKACAEVHGAVSDEASASSLRCTQPFASPHQLLPVLDYESRGRIMSYLRSFGHHSQCTQAYPSANAQSLWKPSPSDDIMYRALFHFLHQLQHFTQIEAEVVPIAARLIHAIVQTEIIPQSSHEVWAQWGLIAFMIASKHASDILDLNPWCVVNILRDMGIIANPKRIHAMEIKMMQAIDWIIPWDPTIDCLTMVWREWRRACSFPTSGSESEVHAPSLVLYSPTVEKEMEQDVIALYLALVQHPVGTIQWWTPLQITAAILGYACVQVRDANVIDDDASSTVMHTSVLNLTTHAVQSIMGALSHVQHEA
jgi:hypothetical protein